MVRLLTNSLFAFVLVASGLSQVEAKDYASPKRFEKEIQAFEASDKRVPPPRGAIVFYGSSSFRNWRDTLKADFAPLTVVPRGFGGSNMNDAVHFADRVLLPLAPRAVVIYEGENDVAQGISPQKIVETSRVLVQKIHKQYPKCRIYYVSIKLSPARREFWPNFRETNRLMKEECEKHPLMTFIDVASKLLDDKGETRLDLFVKDKVHHNRLGYEIWRKEIRPILLKHEQRFEQQ